MQIPTSELLIEYQKLTRDTSAANIIVGKRRINHYYTLLLSESNNHVIERTKYGTSKDGQRAYLLPPDYIFMKRVRIYLNGEWHLLIEVKNLDEWSRRTVVAVEVSIPTHWMVINEQGQMRLEIDGIPNADGAEDNIEIIYQGYQDRLLFPDDYTTGIVSIVKKTATVNGRNGSVWTSAMVSRFLQIENGKYWYDIKRVPGTNQITLVNSFQEEDVTDGNYRIAEGMRLPEEYEYTPLWGAVADYYKATNTLKAKTFSQDYVSELTALRSKYQKKTMGAVTPGIRVGTRISGVPRNYPTRNIG